MLENLHFLKNWHPVRVPMSFPAKEEKKKLHQIKDKQTPHTVLQKLSPKPTPSLLGVWKSILHMKELIISITWNNDTITIIQEMNTYSHGTNLGATDLISKLPQIMVFMSRI